MTLQEYEEGIYRSTTTAAVIVGWSLIIVSFVFNIIYALPQ